MWIQPPSIYPSVYVPVPQYHWQKHSSDFQQVRPISTKRCPAVTATLPTRAFWPSRCTTAQCRAVSHSSSHVHDLTNNNSPNVKRRHNIKMLSSSSSDYYGKTRTYQTGQLISCNNCDTALCCSVQSSHRLPRSKCDRCVKRAAHFHRVLAETTFLVN